MKICPKCHKLVTYNSYFGAYSCTKCDWSENVRVKGNVIKYVAVPKCDSKMYLVELDEDEQNRKVLCR